MNIIDKYKSNLNDKLCIVKLPGQILPFFFEDDFENVAPYFSVKSSYTLPEEYRSNWLHRINNNPIMNDTCRIIDRIVYKDRKDCIRLDAYVIQSITTNDVYVILSRGIEIIDNHKEGVAPVEHC